MPYDMTGDKKSPEGLAEGRLSAAHGLRGPTDWLLVRRTSPEPVSCDRMRATTSASRPLAVDAEEMDALESRAMSLGPKPPQSPRSAVTPRIHALCMAGVRGAEQDHEASVVA